MSTKVLGGRQVFQSAFNSIRHWSSGLDGILQLIRRHAEFLAPIMQLVTLAQVDPLAALRCTAARVVDHV